MKNVQYVVDSAGRKTAVIMPIEDYEKMLAESRLAANEGNEEQTLDYTEAVKEIRESGEIDI